MNVTLLNVKKNVTESVVNFDVIVNFGIVQKCFLVHNSHLPVKKERKRFAKKQCLVLVWISQKKAIN